MKLRLGRLVREVGELGCTACCLRYIREKSLVELLLHLSGTRRLLLIQGLLLTQPP